MKLLFTLCILLITSFASFASYETASCSGAVVGGKIITGFSGENKRKDTVIVKKDKSFRDEMRKILLKFEK